MSVVKERPVRTAQTKRTLEKEREKLRARLQEINAISEADADSNKSEKLTLAKLRSALV